MKLSSKNRNQVPKWLQGRGPTQPEAFMGAVLFLIGLSWALGACDITIHFGAKHEAVEHQEIHEHNDHEK